MKKFSDDEKRMHAAVTPREEIVARMIKAEGALEKINEIRNSIVGMQGFNFSEHAYPLVAALNDAGLEGLPYPEAKANLGTLIEQRDKAESRWIELLGWVFLDGGEVVEMEGAEKAHARALETIQARDTWAQEQAKEIGRLTNRLEISEALGGVATDASGKAEARVRRLEEEIRKAARNAVTGGEASCALDYLEGLLPQAEDQILDPIDDPTVPLPLERPEPDPEPLRDLIEDTLGEGEKSKPSPCTDPDKMLGAADQHSGHEYPGEYEDGGNR